MARGIENIIINDKTYKVEKLGVLETLGFHVEFMHSLGGVTAEAINVLSDLQQGKPINSEDIGTALAKLDPEVVKKIQIKVLAQVVTPENKFLNDPVYIEDWFSRPENSYDAWELMVEAARKILGEHLPSFMRNAPKREKTTE